MKPKTDNTSSSIFSLAVPALISAQNYSWALGIGGVGVEQTKTISIDASQNIIIAGYFSGEP